MAGSKSHRIDQGQNDQNKENIRNIQNFCAARASLPEKRARPPLRRSSTSFFNTKEYDSVGPNQHKTIGRSSTIGVTASKSDTKIKRSLSRKSILKEKLGLNFDHGAHNKRKLSVQESLNVSVMTFQEMLNDVTELGDLANSDSLRDNENIINRPSRIGRSRTSHPSRPNLNGSNLNEVRNSTSVVDWTHLRDKSDQNNIQTSPVLEQPRTSLPINTYQIKENMNITNVSQFGQKYGGSNSPRANSFIKLKNLSDSNGLLEPVFFRYSHFRFG